MSWCYAIINNRLGEIYFDRKGDKVIIQGHCYLDKDDHLTLRDAHDIQQDIPHNQFSYYRGSYRHKI